jgi:hypothetical protein
MTCCNAGLAAGACIVTISLFIVPPSVTAGPDQVKFPIYQTHVLYDVLDQPENKEVRELYVNPEALKGLTPGQPLPSGTVLSAPTFEALLNDRGEFVRDANGRLIRGSPGPRRRHGETDRLGCRVSRSVAKRRVGIRWLQRRWHSHCTGQLQGMLRVP